MRFLAVTVWRGAVVLLSLTALIGSLPPDVLAEGLFVDGVCGTYPGRVLDEIARHQQFVQQRIRQGFRPLSATASAAVDVGHIAVLPDDGTLVQPANPFDLDGQSLTFTPAADVFSVRAGPSQFDSAAAGQGILLNPSPASNPDNIGDDGTREVSLRFPFPHFGESYTSVFINSDGNLTFREGDTSHSERVLSRVLSGPPRIAPYYADLDPSVGGQLTYLSLDTRFVVTWSSVPDYAEFGVGPRETVQVELFPDGLIRFSYGGINGREAVVGVSPGSFSGAPAMVDLSQAAGQPASAGAVAEIFSRSTQLDLPAVARRFYETHDDAYEFLVVFTTFDFDLGGAFAFEANIANEVTGIGPIGDPPVFDFARSFGSSRLESLLNMGNLQKYPEDPQTQFLGENSTLSILGQEAGHRFLTYVRWDDPEGSANSTALLGRDLQHWSFYFNSDASVMEGNRIRDNGDGTFTTTGAVERYSDLDQYLMGLLSPEEVTGSFLVKNPISAFTASSPPRLNANFSGHRANVTIDQIISANGPRVPSSDIAPRNFNFAFLLVAPRNTTPSTAQVAKLDRIRQGWEQFFGQATAFRGTAHTSLTLALSWTPRALGLLAGTAAQVQVELQAASASDVTVTLSNSNPATVAVPESVVIPAGSRSASVAVTGVAPGRASVNAAAPGFETGTAVIEVVAGVFDNGLELSIERGDRQIGSPGAALPQPLSVIIRDENRVPFSGVRVDFAVIRGDASLSSSAGAATDTQGRSSTEVTLGPAAGPVTVTATVPGTSFGVEFSLFTVGAAEVPQAGIVQGASFLPGAVSAGSIISIFGVNLAAAEATAPSLPLPTELAGASVTIGGRAAPLYYVSPGQINAQIPVELSTPSTSLVVQNGASSSDPVTIFLRPANPGIFAQNSSGSGPGVITHPSTNLLVTTDSPASPGEVVQIYAAGLGPVAPFLPSGRPAADLPLSRTLSLPSVTMNGMPATVSFSGLAPGFVGLYQVNAQVPQGIQGTVSVTVSVEGISSNAVTMEVR